MTYRYVNEDVPSDRNFIDIEGPDGMLSHDDVLLMIEQREWLRRLVFHIIPAGNEYAPIELTEHQRIALRECDRLGALHNLTGVGDDTVIIDERSIEQMVRDGDILHGRDEA